VRSDQSPLGTVVVTGGASGLGAATACAIAACGGHPVVLDRQEPSADLEHELVDLSDTAAAEEAVARVVARRGGLDAVVTCAGTDVPAPLDALDRQTWERIVTVNLLATAATVRAALPSLLESHGSVVTVASTLGLRGAGDATAYCASKFGVIGFTRALAAETAGRIGVTLLIPGGMSTAFFDTREEQYRPPPDAALSPPSEVADAVVYALTRPRGVEVRELVVCPSQESSWP
jgi:NAD(P)-dependent dehydrogenase (short-subunit alcohol dehydrogenase family)